MKKPYTISVSGISGSGKTTVARALSSRLPNACALYFDDYPFARQPEDIGAWIEAGSKPDAWDLSLLERDIEQAVNSGCYDYLVIDYPFGKNSGYSIRSWIDTAFYLDTPLDIALARRLLRDFKMRSVKDILAECEAYLSTRKYFINAESSMTDYDCVIDGSRSISGAIGEMRSFLSQITDK